MHKLLATLMSITLILSSTLYANCPHNNPLLHLDALKGDQVVEQPVEETQNETAQECQSEKPHRPKPILPKGKCPHCETDTTAWGDCWNPECEYYNKPVL